MIPYNAAYPGAPSHLNHNQQQQSQSLEAYYAAMAYYHQQHLSRNYLETPRISNASYPGPPSKMIRKTPMDYRSLYIQAGKRIYPPRSASTVLSDILGYQALYNFSRDDKGHHGCSVMIKDRLHSVTGKSTKKEAKEAVAEMAIPPIIVEKYQTQKQKGPQLDHKGRPLDFEKMEDEIPWASLCTLALYKMYQEWTSSGYKIPEKLYNLASENKSVRQHRIAPGGVGRIISNDQGKEDTLEGEGIFPEVTPDMLEIWKKEEAKTGKAVPENPTSRNPVQLINEIRNDVKFETFESGSQPNVLYTTTITLEGKVYQGEARNKKDSRRICALNVLKSIYKIIYPDSPI